MGERSRLPLCHAHVGSRLFTLKEKKKKYNVPINNPVKQKFLVGEKKKKKSSLRSFEREFSVSDLSSLGCKYTAVVRSQCNLDCRSLNPLGNALH